jgi:transketolase
MADIVKKATRDAFGDGVIEAGGLDESVIVLTADLGESTKVGGFKKAFPDRFINCGIAEQNMMGVAAGLAAAGKKVVASSFAMFAAGRPYEIIRNSIGYPHLNVKIGATHAGLSVGEDGATHQCCEDIALMRTIPGMIIINPSDYVEGKACVKAALEIDGPVYMRFGRLAVPVINDKPDYKFEIGKAVTLCEGRDLTIIATGLMVNEALIAEGILRENGISARVINMHTIKPIDRETIVKAANDTGLIITAEEHSIIGGLGSAVCEVVTECCPVPVIRVGVNDTFGTIGPALDVLAKYGLSAENIAEKAMKALKEVK